MSGFEFVFSLFGLLLGLALAAGLGGLARALKVRHRVRIGWPTALLGLFVSCDVVTFWMYGWSMREVIPISWPVLFGGFVVTGLFYVAASLVFPDDPAEWADLDAHFDKQRRVVLGAVLLCNVALIASVAVLAELPPLTLQHGIVTWSFFPVAAIGIAAKDRRIVVACLVWLILLYPLSVLWR
jgi:xanthine/uracil permease